MGKRSGLRRQPSLTRRTMRVSIVEGAYAQIHATVATIGSAFVTQFGMLLRFSPLMFSLLTAISQVSQVFQLIGVGITRRLESRKRVTIVTAAIGRALTFFVGFCLMIQPLSLARTVFLLLMLGSTAFSAVSGNIWTAWMSNVIPENIRGRYFSRRYQIHLAIGLLSGYLFSFAIDSFGAAPNSIQGRVLYLIGLGGRLPASAKGPALGILFAFVSLLSIYGLRILGFQHENPKRKESASLFLMLRQPLRDRNFRRLLLFGCWWPLTLGVGSAFWAPFMMDNLKMSMTEVLMYSMISTLTMLVCFRPWGRLIDRYGNKTAMKIAIIVAGLNPMFWLFLSRDSYWLIWIEAMASGLTWSGVNLVSTNFVMSLAPKTRVQSYAAVYAAVTGVSMMLSTLLSGIFFPPSLVLFGLHLSPEQVLFGLGGLLRWTAEIPLSRIRETKSVSLWKLFMSHLIPRVLYTRSWRNKWMG